jgi:hypothetical protein
MVLPIISLVVAWLTTILVAYTHGERNGYRAGKRGYR